MESPKKITQEKYLEKSICPICHSRVNKSDYLNEIFGDEPQVEWLANLITHYRHDHITSWDKFGDVMEVHTEVIGSRTMRRKKVR